MSATFESLVVDGHLSSSAPSRQERPNAGRAPAPADEPTVLVRTFPGAHPRPKGSATERLGRALVRLRNGNTGERLAAARELGDIAFLEGTKLPEAVVPLVVTLQSDSDAGVRQEAAWSLWKLGDGRAHRALVAALVGDRSTRVRERVARALGLLGVREAAPVMVDLLGLGKHVPGRLRAAMAAALGFLADEEALPLIIGATDDADAFVRQEAVQALGRYLVGFSPLLTEQVFRRILRYVRARREPLPAIRQAAIRALRLSPDERANVAVARTAVNDPDSATREAAAEALLLWNSAHSESALIALLADDVWAVRKTAARALSRFIARHGVHDSSAACEALSRMLRMFPALSRERALVQKALASL